MSHCKRGLFEEFHKFPEPEISAEPVTRFGDPWSQYDNKLGGSRTTYHLVLNRMLPKNEIYELMLSGVTRPLATSS